MGTHDDGVQLLYSAFTAGAFLFSLVSNAMQLCNMRIMKGGYCLLLLLYTMAQPTKTRYPISEASLLLRGAGSSTVQCSAVNKQIITAAQAGHPGHTVTKSKR